MATIKNSYPKEGETHDVLSVPINDTGFYTDNIFLYHFVFRDRNKEIGRIYIKEGKIHFEGDMTESAQIFFNHLKQLWDRHTENKTVNEQKKPLLITLLKTICTICFVN